MQDSLRCQSLTETLNYSEKGLKSKKAVYVDKKEERKLGDRTASALELIRYSIMKVAQWKNKKHFFKKHFWVQIPIRFLKHRFLLSEKTLARILKRLVELGYLIRHRFLRGDKLGAYWYRLTCKSWDEKYVSYLPSEKGDNAPFSQNVHSLKTNKYINKGEDPDFLISELEGIDPEVREYIKGIPKASQKEWISLLGVPLILKNLTIIGEYIRNNYNTMRFGLERRTTFFKRWFQRVRGNIMAKLKTSNEAAKNFNEKALDHGRKIFNKVIHHKFEIEHLNKFDRAVVDRIGEGVLRCHNNPNNAIKALAKIIDEITPTVYKNFDNLVS